MEKTLNRPELDSSLKNRNLEEFYSENKVRIEVRRDLIKSLDDRAKELSKSLIDIYQRVAWSKAHVRREPEIYPVAIWVQDQLLDQADAIIKELNRLTREIMLFSGKWKEVGKTKGIDKESVRIQTEDLMEIKYGSRLRRIGGGKFMTNCPFHADKTPSFLVDAKGGTHCFSCGFHSSDCFDFIQKADGVDFIEAVKIVASL